MKNVFMGNKIDIREINVHESRRAEAKSSHISGRITPSQRKKWNGLRTAPAAIHAEWVATRAAQGWKLGKTKDFALKTNPLMCPFAHLPLEKQKESEMLIDLVRTLRPMIGLNGSSSGGGGNGHSGFKNLFEGSSFTAHTVNMYGV